MDNQYKCNCKEMKKQYLNWICPVHGIHELKNSEIAEWEEEYKRQVTLRDGETEEEWMKRQVGFIKALINKVDGRGNRS